MSLMGYLLSKNLETASSSSAKAQVPRGQRTAAANASTQAAPMRIEAFMQAW